MLVTFNPLFPFYSINNYYCFQISRPVSLATLHILAPIKPRLPNIKVITDSASSPSHMS